MISWISVGLIVTRALAQDPAVPSGTSGATGTHPAGRMERIQRMDPRLKPGDVERLKKGATELKEVYDLQAKERDDLRALQAREHDDLLKVHREARRSFGEQKHTREQRSDFFHNQRREMAALETKHKTEQADLAAKQKKELEQFHAAHKGS
jgi:hypothetical protein